MSKQQIDAAIAAQMRKNDAKDHRRRLMQGLGNPIVSVEQNGYRVVAVGSQVRWSKHWVTFADFLFDYIKFALGHEWGMAEQVKPKADQHPLFHWLRKIARFQKAHTEKLGEVFTAEPTGAVRAYLGLAYDLYLSAHNAELPERLLKRLRHPDQFEGALYEAFVIGSFAKAGFSIAFEDEDDASRSHCEFTATHKDSGGQFSVEAKAVTSASKRSGGSEEAPKIRGYLYDALRKEAAHPRIIFIELSRVHRVVADGVPEWLPHIHQELEECEEAITVDGQPAPEAYVFVTNRSFLHDLDGTSGVDLWAVSGFRIHDFPPGKNAKSMLDMVDARERHMEVHWLQKALQAHRDIPTTFDDRLPEEVFGDVPDVRLEIGQTYVIPDAEGNEVAGVLEDAIVMEPKKQAQGIYRLEDGRRVIVSAPLSDDELAAYKRSPESFFGELKYVGNDIQEPLEAFDFIYGTYSDIPRETLLEFLKSWPEFDALSLLDQPELARRYAAGIGTQIWSDIKGGNIKLTKD